MDRWKVSFVWNDGTADFFFCETAKERDFNIKDMIKRKDFNSITYCRLYANGEEGTNKVAYQDPNRRVRESYRCYWE